jgi:hypothetical protein
MTSFYVHRPLGETVEAIGGSYRLVKEERLPFEGRDVLYLVGHALFDSTCCGVGGCGYALVQGHVGGWRTTTSADGLPMTEVEPIDDEALRDRIRRALVEREKVQQVNFR